jgi:hypothetical protein
MATSKLSKEELETIGSLQNDNQFVRQEFGKLAVDKIRLEQREASLKGFLNELGVKEADLNKLLVEKYGAGTVDLEKGEITVENSSTEVKTQKIGEVDEDN